MNLNIKKTIAQISSASKYHSAIYVGKKKIEPKNEDGCNICYVRHGFQNIRLLNVRLYKIQQERYYTFMLYDTEVWLRILNSDNIVVP